MAAVCFDTYMLYLIGTSYLPECNEGYQMLQAARLPPRLGWNKSKAFSQYVRCKQLTAYFKEETVAVNS